MPQRSVAGRAWVSIRQSGGVVTGRPGDLGPASHASAVEKHEKARSAYEFSAERLRDDVHLGEPRGAGTIRCEVPQAVVDGFNGWRGVWVTLGTST